MSDRTDYSTEGRVVSALERIADALEEGNRLNQLAWDENHDEELMEAHMKKHAGFVADAQMNAQALAQARQFIGNGGDA